MKNKLGERLFWILILLLAWQFTASSGIFSEMVFPSPLKVISSLLISVKEGDLVQQLLFSFSIIVKGLIISTILALLSALAAHFSQTAASFIDTLAAVAHPLPGIALMPLVLIWFGSGQNAILIVIIHSVFWPLLLNLRSGFNSIPEIYILIAQNYKLNKLELMGKILVPASLPYFLAGMKIAWARSWRALISAEMLFGAINSIGGIGWFIFQKRVFFDLPGVFSGIIVIILIGVIVEDFIFNKLEQITVKKWGMTQ